MYHSGEALIKAFLVAMAALFASSIKHPGWVHPICLAITMTIFASLLVTLFMDPHIRFKRRGRP